MRGSRGFAFGLATGMVLLLPACVGGNPLMHSSAVKIRTSPEGALARSEYGDSCTTPCSLRLPKNRGGWIRITRPGYDPMNVSIGSRQDDYQIAASAAGAVGQVTEPNPISIGFDALHYLIDGKGHFRKLDARRVEIDLIPRGTFQPIDVQQARVEPLANPATVHRLNREEVDAILGPPIPERPFPFTEASQSTAPAPGGS